MPLPPVLDQYCVSVGRSVTEPHLFAHLMERGKAPFLYKGRNEPLPLGPFQHAYHFDQAKVGPFLRRQAPDMTVIDAVVTHAARDPETGDITGLHLDTGSEISADFVIDCTGFRRHLIGQEMGATWTSYAADLPVNRAMPFWLDHAQGAEISPYTLAWAQKSGWMWMIPTGSRIGCGYAYCDAFATPEQVQAELEAVLGRPVEPRADIAIDAGRLDRAWIGNCLALGLAQSFFEPLEATSIHGTIVQLLLFARALPGLFRTPRRLRDAYNAAAARQGDDFCDFINLHYVSERRDSPFWRDVADTRIIARTRERIAGWQQQLPRRSDFEPFPADLPHIEEQLYFPVLDGLGLLDKATAKAELALDPKLRAHARKTVDGLVREFRKAAGRAPSHRQFLMDVAAGSLR